MADTRPSVSDVVSPGTNGEIDVAAVVHGRVRLIRPTAGSDASAVVVGFHGYGEDGSKILAELERIPGAGGRLLAAVDALHPFYNTKTGDVVRSWMTKDDRERAIADNLAYVGAAIAALRRETGTTAPLFVAGFSQGVAMAWRAAIRSGHPVRGVVALAGDVPPELVSDPEATFPSAALLGRGDADTWYTAEKLAQDVAALEGKGVAVEVETFSGGHVWSDEYRAAAGVFLDRLAGRSS